MYIDVEMMFRLINQSIINVYHRFFVVVNESHSVLARSSNNKIAVVIRVLQQVIRAIFWYLFDNMII